MNHGRERSKRWESKKDGTVEGEKFPSQKSKKNGGP